MNKLCGIILVAAAAGANNQIAPPAREAVDLVLRCLGVAYPYTFSPLRHHLDGGSVSGVLEGGNGVTVPFIWDNRMRIEGTPSCTDPHNVYIGSREIENPKANKLPVGSEKEAAFIAVLQIFANERVPVVKQDSLRRVFYDYSRPVADRERNLSWMTHDQKVALELSGIASLLERQRLRVAVEDSAKVKDRKAR